MTLTMYGIKNCDTIKKARDWLDGSGVAYAFHDYKSAGIDPATLDRWIGKLGWEVLLNKAGTTFKKLPDSEKVDLDAVKAKALMIAQPSMIKRPVLDVDGDLLVGFNLDRYEQVLAAA
ncbi:ArsC family reductase [Rhizorhapis suberifaciens]|uniref:Arsenate reductase n=1 Tax=Rhizorhapis suberifaciens TaxID=13656 RepID=A0A840HUS4_9SPHN|nr:ArsC family reductase [Rhizorhapis suberifaciens]MBB4641347.1 arsenate reductase [Rhizorhapis suberifaciens]